MALNCAARPDVLPWFKIDCVDFKVTDPAAADPNAPVGMLYTLQLFKVTLTVKITGLWKQLFTGPGNMWETNFYADAIGIDVAGELKWSPAPASLGPAIAPDTYAVSFTVAAGLPTPGIYEFGAVIRLPGSGIHGHCSGQEVEFSKLLP